MTTTSSSSIQASSDHRPVVVGGFVFIGLSILLGGVLTVGDLHNSFTRKLTVSSVFDDVGGLQSGDNVWFSGMKIGTVHDLEFSGGAQVTVHMLINTASQEYIRKDTSAKISSDGLIGNKIVVLHGGTRGVGAVAEGDILVTDAVESTDDMMAVLRRSNDNLLAITTDLKVVSAEIASGRGTMGAAIFDAAMAEGVGDALASAQSAAANSARLTNSLSTYAAKLNDPRGLANRLATDTTMFDTLSESADRVRSASDHAEILVSGLEHASTDPNTAVGVLLHDRASAANLSATLSNLQSGTAKLDDDLEAVQHNFLLRGFFKRRAKAQAKANAPQAEAQGDLEATTTP